MSGHEVAEGAQNYVMWWSWVFAVLNFQFCHHSKILCY